MLYSKVSMYKKIFNLTIISVKKRNTPLERAHDTEKNNSFPASLGFNSQEIQSIQ